MFDNFFFWMTPQLLHLSYGLGPTPVIFWCLGKRSFFRSFYVDCIDGSSMMVDIIFRFISWYLCGDVTTLGIHVWGHWFLCGDIDTCVGTCWYLCGDIDTCVGTCWYLCGDMTTLGSAAKSEEDGGQSVGGRLEFSRLSLQSNFRLNWFFWLSRFLVGWQSHLGGYCHQTSIPAAKICPLVRASNKS